MISGYHFTACIWLSLYNHGSQGLNKSTNGTVAQLGFILHLFEKSYYKICWGHTFFPNIPSTGTYQVPGSKDAEAPTAGFLAIY